MWLILLVAAVTAPIAYWQYGISGAVLVGLAVITMLLSVVLASWTARRMADSNRAAMAMLAGTAIRMVLPLTLVLAVVIVGRGRVDRHSVLYILPIYLAMLVVETYKSVRKANPSQNAANAALQSHKKQFGN